MSWGILEEKQILVLKKILRTYKTKYVLVPFVDQK